MKTQNLTIGQILVARDITPYSGVITNKNVIFFKVTKVTEKTVFVTEMDCDFQKPVKGSGMNQFNTRICTPTTESAKTAKFAIGKDVIQYNYMKRKLSLWDGKPQIVCYI